MAAVGGTVGVSLGAAAGRAAPGRGASPRPHPTPAEGGSGRLRVGAAQVLWGAMEAPGLSRPPGVLLGVGLLPHGRQRLGERAGGVQQGSVAGPDLARPLL